MIEVRVFGPGVVLHDGRPVAMRTAKTFALLAYLALAPGHGQGHARGRLAGLFWPEDAERDARHSLRQALHALRHAAGGALATWLRTDGEFVRLVPSEGLSVDALRFEQCAAGLSPADWRIAAALYRAPLLDGRRFADGAGIDAWLMRERERLHSLATHNLDRLAADGLARGALDAGRDHAGALRDLDPCSEVASRHLLRIAAARHDSAALHAEWIRLGEALADAYDAPPTETTRRLYLTLAGQVATSAPSPGAGGGMAGRAPVPLDRPVRAVDADPLLRAARSAERVYAYGPAVDLYDRALAALGTASGDSATRRLEVLMRKESALDRLGRRREQAAVVDAMFDAIQAGADPALQPMVLLRLAGVCSHVGDAAGARRAALAARDGFREAADRPGEGEALRELGFAAWRAGDHAEALRQARAALALHREIGDPGGEASAVHNLAELHRELGSPRQALTLFEQALTLHWAAGNRHGEVLTRFGIAQAVRQSGDASGAVARLDEARSLAARHGERTMEARAWHLRALWRAADGDLDDAIGAMQQALDIDRAIHYGHGLGHDLVTLAMLHARRGEAIEAGAALQEAAIWFELIEDHEAAERARADAMHLAIDGPGSLADRLAPAPDPREAPDRHMVRSSLALAEGKVYCTFESPLSLAG